MCFSAGGSFAVAGVLAAVGTASLVRASSPAYRMFAAVPLLFAAQQAAEGVIWRTLDAPAGDPLHRAAILVFLGVALVAWPTWLPLALLAIERRPARRRALTALALFGVAISAYAAFLLGLGHPAARVAGHSLRYAYGTVPGIASSTWYVAAYLLPTVVPFFVSTAPLARTIGAAFVVALAVALAIEHQALTSVWCFFAAALSTLVLVAVSRDAPLETASGRADGAAAG